MIRWSKNILRRMASRVLAREMGSLTRECERLRQENAELLVAQGIRSSKIVRLEFELERLRRIRRMRNKTGTPS